MSHPFINQMNRTFIDLLYYLIKIFKELKLEENLIDIYNILNNNFLKIGDNLFRTHPEKQYYKWLLEPLAIMRFLMINSKIQEDSVILSKSRLVYSPHLRQKTQYLLTSSIFFTSIGLHLSF